MATYLAQRQESFTGEEMTLNRISQCGVSILTDQNLLLSYQVFNYFGTYKA